jgi:DNA invertase Pin-like site-specific DNA recombinase
VRASRRQVRGTGLPKRGRHFRVDREPVARREIDMVAAWSVDRLGRSLTGLLELLTELHAKQVDLYLHQQGLDTSTPSGRAISCRQRSNMR